VAISFSSTFKNIVKPHSYKIDLMGDIGLISLMFFAGVKSSDYFLKKNLKDTSIISISSVFFSFITGYFFSRYWGFSYIISTIVGICLSVTAESINAKILMEEKMLDTDIGSITMGAGLIDDVISIISFSLILCIITGNNNHTKEYIILSMILLVYLIGIVYKKHIKKLPDYDRIEKIILNMMVPFLFISMGMHLTINGNINYTFVFFLTVIAIIGKVGGALITKPLVNPTTEQLHFIGWALNARGGIGIALAIIAFRNNIIPNNIYNSLVIVILITSLLFPLCTKYLEDIDTKVTHQKK
tara:strand:+ start:3113 stop:4012 length:900 start_codon:yes stop_codon:yes gene_type:complete